jgi:hypothetical protein
VADGDTTIGYSGDVDAAGNNTQCEDELLEPTTSGVTCANGNIGLTAIHEVFRSDRNRPIGSPRARHRARTRRRRRPDFSAGDRPFVRIWLFLEGLSIVRQPWPPPPECPPSWLSPALSCPKGPLTGDDPPLTLPPACSPTSCPLTCSLAWCAVQVIAAATAICGGVARPIPGRERREPFEMCVPV